MRCPVQFGHRINDRSTSSNVPHIIVTSAGGTSGAAANTNWRQGIMFTAYPNRRSFLLAAGILSTARLAQAQEYSHEHQVLTPEEKERQAFQMLALRMFVEVDSDDTNGAVAVVRVFVPPGAGAAPHVHSREDEVFEVVRGHYRFRHGDQEVDAPVGTILFLPRGIPHTFRNVSDEPGEHTVTLVPGGLEKMFRETSTNNIQLPRDAAKNEAIALKYGVTLLPPSSLPLSV
jgi:mannose-6-phosphate isomerase-like protein (cupin superfamily)